MTEVLPAEVATDLAELLRQLQSLGIRPTQSEYSAGVFGNYFVDFEASAGAFRVVRERSQYLLYGKEDELRARGLWRAFDDKKEFENAVLSWVRHA